MLFCEQVIDDYSKKTWVYFMACKDEIVNKFHLFWQEVETCISQQISLNFGKIIVVNTLHTIFWPIVLMLASRDNLLHHTPFNINGVSKRCNHYLLDITQCFLLDKILPQFLWGKAIRATCCVLNLRSTKFHHDKILEEFFFGKKPLVAHLHVCRSIIYVHNNKPNQGKLVAHSEECILFNHVMTRSNVIVVISHPHVRSLFLEMSRLWRLLIQSSKTMILLLLITLTTHLCVQCLHQF